MLGTFVLMDGTFKLMLFFMDGTFLWTIFFFIDDNFLWTVMDGTFALIFPLRQQCLCIDVVLMVFLHWRYLRVDGTIVMVPLRWQYLRVYGALTSRLWCLRVEGVFTLMVPSCCRRIDVTLMAPLCWSPALLQATGSVKRSSGGNAGLPRENSSLPKCNKLWITNVIEYR